MKKEKNNSLIIWAVAALVIGVILGVIITNTTTTGQAKSAVGLDSGRQESDIVEARRDLVLNLLKVNRIENNDEPLHILNEFGTLSINSSGQNGRVSISSSGQNGHVSIAGTGDIILNSNEAIQMGAGISAINMYAYSENGPKMNLKSHWLTLGGNHIALTNTQGDAAVNINPSGEIQFPNLPDVDLNETATYACLTPDGTLFSSQTPCNNSVLDKLNQCFAFEMGQAAPMQYFGQTMISGNDMCNWKGQQIGQNLTCIGAGRIYSTADHSQTGYGVWSCGREDIVMEGSHNGWALCCPSE